MEEPLVVWGQPRAVPKLQRRRLGCGGGVAHGHPGCLRCSRHSCCMRRPSLSSACASTRCTRSSARSNDATASAKRTGTHWCRWVQKSPADFFFPLSFHAEVAGCLVLVLGALECKQASVFLPYQQCRPGHSISARDCQPGAWADMLPICTTVLPQQAHQCTLLSDVRELPLFSRSSAREHDWHCL